MTSKTKEFEIRVTSHIDLILIIKNFLIIFSRSNLELEKKELCIALHIPGTDVNFSSG